MPQILAGIKDGDIRTWLRVAYALALTGNSPNTITTTVTRKNQPSVMTSDSSR